MRIPKWVLPLLAIVTILAGYNLRWAFTKPTTSVELVPGGAATMICTVEGVKCRGTANYFTRLYAGTRGINAIETIAEEHKATFRFDPAVITPDSIRAIMEQEVTLRDGSKMQVFKLLDSKVSS